MAAPDRPTAEITSIDHDTREIVVAVVGTATVFRAELFDLSANVVASNEISASGDITVIAPSRGVSYSLIVIAGDGSVPINWSQPGIASAVVIRPLEEEESSEAGVGVTSVPSSPVQEAGPMGAGLAFPFRFSETTGAPEANVGIDHVVDGMKQILLTRVNGRIIRRDFGSPLAGKLFAPDTRITQDTVAMIQSVLAEFERRAEVTAVVLRRDRTKGTLTADIKFRTYRTHQDGNLVYPFNLNPQA
jgi:phage baseplate assembly protein W